MKTLNNFNRNIAVGFLAITILSTNVGCQKLLDTQRQGEYTADDYPYPQGGTPYDTFLFSAYSALRAYNYVSDGFMVATSIRSDDADKGSTPTDGGADVIAMDNFPVLTNGRVNTLWTEYYTMINRCNTIIDQIYNNTEIVANDQQKKQAEAEARFLRGYSYFFLVRAFGRVPKIDKVLEVTSNVPQSSPAEIYAFIEADLQFAAANLPLSWPSKFIGRPTKGSANGILAKAYLYQQKWGMAMSMANQVMLSGQYDLSVPYGDIFSEKGENSKESVFEIQATASATVQTANGVQYASIQGTRGTTTEWNRGWGWNSPSAALEAAYEPNDPRKTRTILYSSFAGKDNFTIYGQKAPFYPTEVPNLKYNQKVLANPSFIAAYNTRSGWWMNVRILRYADVVLMFAEAANEVGGSANLTLAQDALNTVRTRARIGAVAGTLPNINTTDQNVLRNAIRQERRVELAMEHERFFDIVRWGIDADAMQAAGKTNYNPNRDRLLPIPQQQIDLSKGVLTQNVGY
ncbi:RagB/SusD family nutrient uptake outer membrane protein [Pedobacter sandarakinus]|uniref:RagB/SusD family nutrient uptake outer membrane protein n=1 Tax=Pedobacter sandarakinus TaxID=353156 RepID=UPI002247B572|nr:RagB/SusD family nutrient uptake outer membrane protein [Pedobacter sandarakinus]MCX2572963.1 RagB/SusD family nutrient uptake outer membrane protein [Pedobacter sandarakinus]